MSHTVVVVFGLMAYMLSMYTAIIKSTPTMSITQGLNCGCMLHNMSAMSTRQEYPGRLASGEGVESWRPLDRDDAHCGGAPVDEPFLLRRGFEPQGAVLSAGPPSDGRGDSANVGVLQRWGPSGIGSHREGAEPD